LVGFGCENAPVSKDIALSHSTSQVAHTRARRLHQGSLLDVKTIKLLGILEFEDDDGQPDRERLSRKSAELSLQSDERRFHIKILLREGYHTEHYSEGQVRGRQGYIELGRYFDEW